MNVVPKMSKKSWCGRYDEWSKRQQWSTFHIGVIAPICIFAYGLFPLVFLGPIRIESIVLCIIYFGIAVLVNSIFCLRVIFGNKVAIFFGAFGIFLALISSLIKINL